MTNYELQMKRGRSTGRRPQIGDRRLVTGDWRPQTGDIRH